MSHRDFGSVAVRLNASCLKLALGWLLREVDWSSVTFRKDCTWTPRLLTAVGLPAFPGGAKFLRLAGLSNTDAIGRCHGGW